MKTEIDFSRELHERVVDENTELYRKMISSDSAHAKGTWKQMIQLFASLDTEQQEAFMRLTRQVIVDTVSTTLLVIDESSSESDAAKQLKLRNGAGIEISGGLQDFFLAEEESKNVPF